MNTAPRLSPRDLWKQLQSGAGLELRLKSGKPGRDADLESAVLVELAAGMSFATSAKTVDELLRAEEKSKGSRITVERLLVAVLTSQGGFAAMMDDILQTLIAAQAQVPERALSMEFEFDQVTGPIRQTLDEFRATVQRTKDVLANTGFELPNFDLRWKLSRELRTLMPPDQTKWNARFNPPKMLSTGRDDLDDLIAELSELVSEFQSACMRFGDDRTEVMETVRNLFPDWHDPEQERQRRLATDGTDYWDAGVLGSLEGIANAVNAGTCAADQMADRLSAALSALPRRHEWVSQTYQELLDILNLPTWRKRHELYSVWVGTALLRAAQRCANDLHFHPVNGVLSFSFAGKRLATYDWNGAQFDVWCELRSALAGPSKKRKKGVQPDFRVVEATLAMPIATATRFVLECKHYLGYSLSNFSTAANDYARSCPRASVFIVNHGPADHDLLIESVDPAVAPKVTFHGGVTAEGRARPHPLEYAIQRVLFPTASMGGGQPDAGAAVGNVLPSAPGQSLITLSWTEALEDLDLALEVVDDNGMRIDRIDFRNKHGTSIPPFARLLADHQSGPGEEVIEIERWEHASYEVSVTNYSESGEMRPDTVHCVAEIDGVYVRLDPSARKIDGHSWRVARIDVATRTVVRAER
jgi:hypothetical protein